MSSIQHSLSHTLRIDCRRFSRYEEKADEESCLLRFKNVIDFICSRHHSLKDMALTFCKTSFPPFIAIVGSLEDRILVIPVAEQIASYIIGIDILRILKPLMM